MRLTVETGPLAGTVVTLDRDQPAVLGSGEDCALRIREAGVQERHAVVKALRGEGFGLKALGPGVRVNGAQIEATPLGDGDVIELGTTRIAFGEMQEKGLPAISGYRIQEEVGRGGMGVVYRAEQVSLSRPVALKVLSHDLTENPRFISNFVAEAQHAAKLQHPNIVSVFDVAHDGDTYFYAMELMDGGSCEDWIKQNGAMPVDRALRVVADAAEGLAYAESLDIVHRDLKPDNLMFDRHGVVKIADLGLAGAEAGAGERTLGTPHFMAPEQVLRKPVDHRSDLYALGCTFHRLVTGRTPFRGQSVKDILRAQVKEAAEPAHKIESKVPTEVSAIIQRLMRKEPAERYQTANDLLEDLAVLLQPPARRGLWIALAAVAVLIAGGVTWWAVNKRGETVTRTEYVNNPEAARLAGVNATLEEELRQDKATIALLQARVGGLADEPLAAALDSLAAKHPDTRAALEAKKRADAIRKQLRERNRRAQELRDRASAHLAKLEQDIGPPLEAHDFAAAIRALGAKPEEEIADHPALAPGIDALRTRILERARTRLGALCLAVDQASAGDDMAKLGAALEALKANLATADRWPEALARDLEQAGSSATRAGEALTALEQNRSANLWQDYRTLFAREGGIARSIETFEFAEAHRLAAQFAAAVPDEPAGKRAACFAEAASCADRFAAAMAGAMSGEGLRFEDEHDQPLTVRAWDRTTGQITVFDPSKRSRKERQAPVTELTPTNWVDLSSQVTAQQEGERECFLAFLLLARHAAAARSFLQTVDSQNDASGTAEQGYPLASDWFDTIARSLPNAEACAWAAILREEIEAGRRLAAGLRALSERRNLAAASHLEKLLAEHGHSYLVMVLP